MGVCCVGRMKIEHSAVVMSTQLSKMSTTSGNDELNKTLMSIKVFRNARTHEKIIYDSSMICDEESKIFVKSKQ